MTVEGLRRESRMRFTATQAPGRTVRARAAFLLGLTPLYPPLLRGEGRRVTRRRFGVCRNLVTFLAVAALSTGDVRATDSDTELVIRRSRHTGLASFVTAADRAAIPVPIPANKAKPEPLDFFKAHGHFFGVTDPSTQLALEKTKADSLGHTHTTYRQVHQGVPVFAGVVKVHQNADGEVTAANGDFFEIPDKLSTKPTIDRKTAERIARAWFAGTEPTVERRELVIVDPGWYGDPPQGVRLAYYLHLVDAASDVAEAFFVDAHGGTILDRWSIVQTDRNRNIFDGNETNSLPGNLARGEGSPAADDFEVDAAYDWSGDAYGYYLRAFGRDSLDDAGMPLVITVHSTAIGCPNAAWRGGIQQAIFCTGSVTDDVIGHELTHGLIDFTADLIYQNQSGQLNESYSDVFGELIDLFNGNVAYAGPPAGTPWPGHSTGPSLDMPNALRTDMCLSGVKLEIHDPLGIAGTYVAAPARFGPFLTEGGVTGDVAMADPPLACSAGLNNPDEINGRIALVDRGDCNFTVKVANAQNAGAIAAIVIDNRLTGFPPTLGGTDPTITISSVGIRNADGELIKSALSGGTVNVTLAANSYADSVRWFVGEDPFGPNSAIRDMWNPPCMGDPDRANSEFQTCNAFDSGGVHSGSGIPNHAFAMVTDGKSFNGYTVSGIGPIKSGAVWYRALATYLTVASDFEDAYDALNQAAADLVGTFPNDPRTGLPSDEMFTAADAEQVDRALLAVEMNTEGACGATVDVLNSDPPELCEGRQVIFEDDFEGGSNGWTVHNTMPPTPYDWVQVGDLPFDRPGTGWFGEDRHVGDCEGQDESAAHYLTSPPISLPDDLFEPTLVFTHFVETEPGWDGGNLWISVQGGPFVHVPGSSFTYNAYNMTLNADNTNPLAGEEGFSGIGGRWGTSVVDLSGFVSGGETVQFQFAFGKDGCTGYDGWYVDDLMVYSCRCFDNAGCDDGVFCNGQEGCDVALGCQHGLDPCPDQGCDEDSDTCVPVGDGDFTENGGVDMRDYQFFQMCIDQPALGMCAPGDMNADLVVDLLDYSLWKDEMHGP